MYIAIRCQLLAGNQLSSKQMTTKPSMCAAIALLATLLVALGSIAGAQRPNSDTSPLAAREPAFPRMFGPNQMGTLKIHIVSESISDEQGYETTEEFLDLHAGRETFIVTSRTGHNVVHIDAMANVVYNYKPYSCAAMKPGELKLPGYGGLWSTDMVKFKGLDGTKKKMHVYGLAALWLNAGAQAKTYAPSKVIYSGSKEDIHRPAHQWTVRWEPAEELYRFYFFQSAAAASNDETSRLEMIEIESLETNQVTKRVNILSYEYEIADDVYDNLLQVPVGYGCVNDAARELAEMKYPLIYQLYMPGPLQNSAHKIDLEVSATKFERPGSGDASGGETRRSDTINVELARALLMERKQRTAVQLVRQRDTRTDTKRILNSLYNVQYTIDLRKGTCEMSHMGEQQEEASSGSNLTSDDDDGDDDDKRAVLKFSNNLTLTIDPTIMRELFVTSKDYHFVKRTNSGPGKLEAVFYEKDSKNVRPGKLSRIVRRYLNVDKQQERLELDSVTIWVFDDNKDTIVESYHLNVVDIVSLSDDQQRAKIFDVSEECYLNNDQMRAGRDYAWFELSYPASSVQLEQLAKSEIGQIKTRVYSQLERGFINFFRVPRVEVMFESSAFTVRLLMLDNPPLQLVYDVTNRTIFEKFDNDIEDMAVDLEHCADLCRLNQCKTMTFCNRNHLCRLSQDWLNPQTRAREGMHDYSCATYTQPAAAAADNPDARVKEVFEMSLHRVLSRLRHQDYSPVALPKRPDELIYPRSETGIDQETYEDIKRQYQFKVMQFINMDMDKLPILNCLALELNGGGEWTIVTPNRFELEQDPLAEWVEHSDSDDDQGDDDEGGGGERRLIPMAFHEGISMRRFKINTLNDDPGRKRNVRLFMRLNYDQCALACADSGRCSSFSYCAHREECIITDIHNIGAFVDNSTESDVDCQIAQRDFVSKFNRFADVHRPVFYKSQLTAYNPSECAHSCMIAPDFNCLAFDFCELPAAARASSSSGSSTQLPGNCFLLQERNLFTGAEQQGVAKQIGSGKIRSNGKSSGCDHYSRSYLADFVRIEYRRLEPEFLGKLKSSLVEGRSVDRCAEICANELMDCSAFQFCFDPEADGAKQSCTMIESKPQAGNPADYQVVLEPSADSKITEAGRAFRPDGKCHVFSLRKDSGEARQRELALSTADGSAANGNKQTKATDGAGLSIGGAIWLYSYMALIFAGLACGFVVAKHRSEFVREKVDRVRLLLGLS